MKTIQQLHREINNGEHYPEDEKPDGTGLYHNVCKFCGEEFLGHKTRMFCKPCKETWEEQVELERRCE